MPKTELFDRSEVLQRAMSVFRKNGFHGTSMQELVDAMGINRSSIYNSFGDKQNLFKETLRLYREQQKSQTHNWLLEATNAKEAIELLFKGIEDEIAEDAQNLGCFMAKSTSEFGNSNVDFFEILTTNQHEMETIFADLVTKGQQTGHINQDLDAKTTAGYLFTSLQGLRLSGLLKPQRAYIGPIVQQILSVL